MYLGMARRLVVCLCSQCAHKTWIDDDGDVRAGNRISSSTRVNHQNRDLELAQHEAWLEAENERQGPVSPAPEDLQQDQPAPNIGQGISIIYLSYVHTDNPIEMASIVDLACFLIAWLALKGGASRETARIMAKAIQYILALTVMKFYRVFHFFNIDYDPLTINIPAGIATIYRQYDFLEPHIISTVACPTCHKQYPNNTGVKIPSKCTWRKNPLRRPECGTPLYKTRVTTNGTLMETPNLYFSTQSFTSWLRFFLGRAEIDKELHKTFITQATSVANPPNIMQQIYDTPAWRSFQDYIKTAYHLVFALYIDWFNPYTNKIAGMSFSCLINQINKYLQARRLPLELLSCTVSIFLSRYASKLRTSLLQVRSIYLFF